MKYTIDVKRLQKAHKYIKREGSSGNYTYYYRLPDGRIGTRQDLNSFMAKETKHKATKRKDIPKMSVHDKVAIIGKNGITISNDGKKYQLKHDSITASTKQVTKNEFINPRDFTANKWKKSFTDEKVTPDQAGVDYILSQFGASGKEIAQEAKKTQERVKAQAETISKYRISGEGKDARYTPERERLHNKIIRSFFSPDKINSARPKDDEIPTFMMLGGRGGSGKSKFNGLVYDSSTFVVIDADAIKKMLPEYQGWNAGEVHEESSDISKKIIRTCKDLGLNIVIDGTMSSGKKAVTQMEEFQNLGYRTEAHYMFLPIQESAKRAISRFKTDKGDYSGRFVPLDMLVKMSENEAAFDEVKNYADVWSFRSNYGVDKNAEPKLISKKG